MSDTFQAALQLQQAAQANGKQGWTDRKISPYDLTQPINKGAQSTTLANGGMLKIGKPGLADKWCAAITNIPDDLKQRLSSNDGLAGLAQMCSADIREASLADLGKLNSGIQPGDPIVAPSRGSDPAIGA